MATGRGWLQLVAAGSHQVALQKVEFDLSRATSVPGVSERSGALLSTALQVRVPLGEPLLLVVADASAPWLVAAGRWRFWEWASRPRGWRGSGQVGRKGLSSPVGAPKGAFRHAGGQEP